MKKPLLSICIATYNRGKYIVETLDSLMLQSTDGIEIIVVDGNSTDNTESVIRPYTLKYSNFYYYREPQNSGVDQDYDKAVSYSNGKYCWLMTDDDILIDNSISKILQLASKDYELIILNSEIWNKDFSKNLQTRMLNLDTDKIYHPDDENNFLKNTATCLSFIGSVVIKKQVWMNRDRKTYFGTLFIHVGVIFQKTLEGNVYVLATPILKVRYGNGMWTPRSFEIWYFKWPQLIWSFERFPKK